MLNLHTSCSDLNKIADGIGHKLGLLQYGMSGFLCGYILAFAYGWKLTLVMLSVFPLLAIAGGALGMVSSSLFSSFLLN